MNARHLALSDVTQVLISTNVNAEASFIIAESAVASLSRGVTPHGRRTQVDGIGGTRGSLYGQIGLERSRVILLVHRRGTVGSVLPI